MRWTAVATGPAGAGQPSTEYAFVTRWVLEAPAAAVWQALADVETWPRWWRGVEAAEMLERGADDGVGQRVRYTFKSALPYALSFETVVRESQPPHRVLVEASGELTGTGRWELAEDGGVTTAVYTWRVSTTRPAMRLLAPLLRPAFGWNHHVVMRWGAESLARRLGVRLVGVHGEPEPRAADWLPLAVATAGLLVGAGLVAQRLRLLGG